MPKLPSQSTDQLSDFGNEEWETASESSDVLAHHHTRDATKPDDSKSGGGGRASTGRRDLKMPFSSGHQPDRNAGESRTGDVRHGLQSSSTGNSRGNQRASRDLGTSRNSVASAADATSRLHFFSNNCYPTFYKLF